MFVDFGRTPRWNCPLPDEEPPVSRTQAATKPQSKAPQAALPSANPWFIPPIECHEPEDGVFYAQIGPTGGESGFNAITG